MTDKDRNALRVLAQTGELRVSNYTDLTGGRVYWQTADRLVSMGYARGRGYSSIEITDNGRKVLG